MFSKLLGLYQSYKWVVLAGLFVVVAASSWDISSKVKANEFNAERIRLLERTIEATKFNDTLKSEMTKTLLEGLAIERKAIQEANKAALNEILTDPRYKSCTVTPGVRSAYRDAIAAQSAPRGNAGAVPTTKAAPVR